MISGLEIFPTWYTYLKKLTISLDMQRGVYYIRSHKKP
jgi:hypothetical protein